MVCRTVSSGNMVILGTKRSASTTVQAQLDAAVHEHGHGALDDAVPARPPGEHVQASFARPLGPMIAVTQPESMAPVALRARCPSVDRSRRPVLEGKVDASLRRRDGDLTRRHGYVVEGNAEAPV